MEKNYKKWVVVLSVLFLSSNVSLAQTFKQTQKVIKSYNVDKLEGLKKDLKLQMTTQKSNALSVAAQNGWEVKKTYSDGRTVELQKVVDGMPIYYTTYNVDASESTRTNHLNSGGSLGLSLMGQGMTAHIWDGGIARASHQEYDGAGGNNRFSVGDGSSSLNFHAAHVTGTVIAAGVQANAKGMAPHAKAVGYDWNEDKAEATEAAANGMLVSNHSYGFRVRDDFGRVLLPQYYFGGYIDESRDWDRIMFNAPKYLMVVAAGNDGGDNTANTNPTGGAGFDILNGHATAKNNIVVANAQDANVNSSGDLISVNINSSSSEGPTDDMRIKPDLTGNGTGLYSSYHSGNSAYGTLTGTSMASPNVTGSLLLLQEHYDNLNGTFMRAATLKGLALHTADDMGVSGPDAVTGWGLLNAKKAAEAISQNGNGSKVEELTLSSGQTYTVSVESDGGPLMASISWTDRPGTANTGVVNLTTPALVNDLDIRVTKGSSTSFPYKLVTPTSSSKMDNKVDPFERVDIANASGSYTITVTHKGSLVGGSQNFSLIVTGISSTPTVCTATVPTGLTDSSVSATAATLSWGQVSGATYDVRYRPVGTTSWTVVPTGATSLTLTGLSASTSYQAQVRSKCSSSNSSFSSTVSFTTSGTQVSYCSSQGASTQYEWIDFVSFGGMTNTTSSDGGYGDYTSKVATVARGASSQIVMSAGFAGSSYNEFVAVWIDFDQDGTFESSELVASGSSNSSANRTGTVNVPAGALLGQTRMRVSMKYNDEPTACESFTYGEVEDYTVNITNGSFAAAKTSFTDVSSAVEVDLEVYPNPVANYLNIESSEKIKSVKIYSATGAKMDNVSEDSPSIDVSDFESGVYLITVETENGLVKKKFIKK